jgi:outer-membrane receptor for ferric coprogen and ferric-rhodotorulic acid
VGLKGSLLEERLNLATALFWSTQDNVAERDDSVTGEEFFKSGGKGNKVQGFEAEVSGEVLQGWNLTAGYTYTHSLNVDNLLDEKYYDNVGFYNGVFWGDPRTVTLSLDWKL